MDCHFAQDRGTHYKRDEIKNFLDNKIIEMKKYDPKELKQLIEDGSNASIVDEFFGAT